MYVPKEFLPEDRSDVLSFLKEQPFGTLISNSDNLEPIATHLPFLMKSGSDDIIFEGHIARNNRHAELLRDGRTALVIFQGPHAYISSSVYGHQNVPTWNYQAVHVYGTVSVMNENELTQHLAELVNQHESDREHQLDYSNMPEELLTAYRKEILGFRINSYRTETAFKLSQNRNDSDFESIIEDLTKDKKNRSIVEAMNRSRNK